MPLRGRPLQRTSFRGLGIGRAARRIGVLLLLATASVGCDDGDDDAPVATPVPTATTSATSTRASTATRTPTRATATPTVTRTPAATATPLTCTEGTPGATDGPTITFFGIARADDVLVPPIGETEDGVPVFARTEGSGFTLVVEAKRGTDREQIGESAQNDPPDSLPDLQIVTSRALGNGSPAVCDDPQSAPGGVPAVEPPVFTDECPAIAHAINDFACRFVDGQGHPIVRDRSDDSCVAPLSGVYAFVQPQSNVQFCGAINVPLAFPKGDTRITVRVRNQAGRHSDPSQIVVRIGPLG